MRRVQHLTCECDAQIMAASDHESCGQLCCCISCMSVCVWAHAYGSKAAANHFAWLSHMVGVNFGSGNTVSCIRASGQLGSVAPSTTQERTLLL